VRSAQRERFSSETKVTVGIELDGSGFRKVLTGLPMLDHLLSQFAFHSGCDLEIAAQSLDAIEHHVIEDVAIVLGEAIGEALGDRYGIARYGWALIPMDDALARAAVDLGGRAFSKVALEVAVEKVEGLESQMVSHFFRSLATKAGITLHVDLLAGSDPHHAFEAAFKAFAWAAKRAWNTAASDEAAIASTKGIL
jgi:imidazoleglycerol-phosphate dehydratase / histidinol-phosphatase